MAVFRVLARVGWYCFPSRGQQVHAWVDQLEVGPEEFSCQGTAAGHKEIPERGIPMALRDHMASPREKVEPGFVRGLEVEA